jgi:hypothetical protein
MSNNENMIRNVWYLNINSNNGLAIGKCGNKGSNLTDLDITAGLITASQQLNNEMVKNNETSKYHIEEIKGGAKRLLLYSNWANDLSNQNQKREIPIITSMLQVSGPEMDEFKYNQILLFLRDLNDEIIYRFMLGELIQERSIEPIIHIDILNQLIKKREGILGKTSNYLEELVENSLSTIFKDNMKLLSLFLSKLPLESTFFQQEYVNKYTELQKFIKKEISQFLLIEAALQEVRKEKIYSEDNSFSGLRLKYNEYLDKQETYFQNKNALKIALERSILTIEDLILKCDQLKDKNNVRSFYELRQSLPPVVDIEDFLEKILKELEEGRNPEQLKSIKENYSYKASDIPKHLIEEGIIAKEESKELYKKLKSLKENLQSIISIAENLAKSDKKRILGGLRDEFEEIIQKSPQFKEEVKNEFYIDIRETVRITNTQYNKIKDTIVSGETYQDNIKKLMKKLRKNLLTNVLDALFSEIFHSYSHFKYVLAYSKDFKQLLINKSIQAINDFYKKIHCYSFANILFDVLGNVDSNNPIQYYSTYLLRSFLSNFLVENFCEHPFAITEENPVLAFDTYSLKFCAEIIKNSGLNERVYKIIEQMNLPEDFKESFIQIIDSSGLIIKDVVAELKDSHEIFNSWLTHIDDLNNSLERVKKNVTPQIFFDQCEQFIEEHKSNTDKEIKKGIYFIKDTILQGTKKGTEQRKELIKNYKKEIELQELREKLKKIEKDAQEIFGGKRPYNKIISRVNSLLSNQLSKDKEVIQVFIEDVNSLVESRETKNLKSTLNKIDNFKRFFDDKKKLKDLEAKLKKVFEYERFKDLYHKLDSLNNQFLKLEHYPHIKGLLKTISSSEPLFGKSNIEYKYKSYDLFLEALVEMYALIYQDYYGSFSFKDAKGIFSDFKISINLGKTFTYQYEQAKKQYYFKTGLDRLQDLFKTIEDYQKKFDYINLNYLFNYVKSFQKKNNLPGIKLVRSFHDKKHFKQFFDYIIDRLSDKKRRSELQEAIRSLYNSLERYLINGGRKPRFPEELKIFNNQQLNILRGIVENVQNSDRSYYTDGSHPDKEHPSNRFNLDEVSKRKLRKFVENIEEMDDLLINDIGYLFKKLSYEREQLRPINEIIEQVHENLKDTIESETYALLESMNFEGINKIRIMSLLNPTKYELPLDIKLYLINKGKYNRKTIEKLTKASTKISEGFKFIINGAPMEDPQLKKMLKKKLKIKEDNTVLFPYELNIPQEISKTTKSALFGKYAIWEEESKLEGFRLNTDEFHKQTYGQVLKASINRKIWKELKPLMDIFTRYSKKIHTRFKTVYKKLFE